MELMKDDFIDRRFVLGEKLLEEAGSTVVYDAIDSKEGGRRVAIKFLYEGSPEPTHFAQEIAIRRRVNHPSIVKVLDQGCHKGLEYMVMDHPDEGNLSKLVFIDERYVIARKIQEGGMGAVFEAIDTQNGDRSVAIKVLHDISSEVVERFEREIEISVGLDHPNIVKILGHGRHDKQAYMVMEYLKGSDLGDLILAERAKGRELSRQSQRDLFMALCSAMEHLHAMGIIHRDLKPSNIMCEVGDDGRILYRVIDFGIVGLEDTASKKRLTRTGTALGTPEYMSPEQMAGAKVDYRCDFFALGTIFYEVVTRGLSHVGDASRITSITYKAAKVAEKLMRDPLPEEHPIHFVPRLLPKYDRLIMDLLARNPANRPQSVAELRQRWEEIEEAFAQRDVDSGRPTVAIPVPSRSEPPPVEPVPDPFDTRPKFDSEPPSQPPLQPRSAWMRNGLGLLAVLAVTAFAAWWSCNSPFPSVGELTASSAVPSGAPAPSLTATASAAPLPPKPAPRSSAPVAPASKPLSAEDQKSYDKAVADMQKPLKGPDLLMVQKGLKVGGSCPSSVEITLLSLAQRNPQNPETHCRIAECKARAHEDATYYRQRCQALSGPGAH